MRNVTLILLCCSLVAEAQDEPMHVFLLVGQSNMAGRAQLEDADRAPAENVFLWNIGAKKWEPATAPFNRFSPHRKQLGMQRLNCGPSFVRAYREAHPDVRVGIVCAARGGTKIEEWEKGRRKPWPLYDSAVAAAADAVAAGDAELRGILWHQGEGNAGRADRYPEQLELLIQNFRRDLKSPNLPFVFSQLGAWRDQYRAFNEMIVRQTTRNPNTGCVRTHGLKPFDTAHFDRDGQRELGRRYAAELLRLQPNAARLLSVRTTVVPLLLGTQVTLAELLIKTDRPIRITGADVDLSGTTKPADLSKLALVTGDGRRLTLDSDSLAEPLSLPAGEHQLQLAGRLSRWTPLTSVFRVKVRSLKLGIGESRLESLVPAVPHEVRVLRPAVAIHRRGEMDCHTTRIPAITRTPNGTLLAVYDMRYNSRRDLQEHIDIGLSRSTDNGQTWEKPRPIMDMGEFGGKPQKENGCSDPNILVDQTTGEIFVSAVWTHGKPNTHQWRDRGSEPGFDIHRSSQFMMVRSTDDGVTWTEPKNLTRDLKNEAWWLFAPAPGNGITLKDGTLVMPTQGRDARGFPFSNLMYSRDHGKSWTLGTAARDNTTECAVAELSDGTLMLNMRDNRNRSNKGPSNGRAVSVTKDLGSTWQTHATDHGALPEPVCMASLISHRRNNGSHVLMFSNPRTMRSRRRMTVQFSDDDGTSWPAEKHVLLDEQGGAYSSLVALSDQHVGILYESSQANLVYQVVPIPEPRAEAAAPLRRILFGSCIKQQHPVPIFDTVLKNNPDVFVFLGDNIYADTEDMEVMRQKYAKLGETAGFRKLWDACDVLATWDDHDYGVNDGGAEYPKREQAQEEFVRFWQVPQDSPRRTRPGIYDSRVYGPDAQRVQVILLDTRYFRSRLTRGERRVGGSWVPSDDPERTMLGEAQWAWLEKQLRVPARLRIVATSVQFIAQDAGQETWSNLPRERKRLLDLIASTEAGGVLMISGDRHWSELSSLADGVPYRLYDLTSSSLNQVHPRGTPTDNRYRASESTYHKPNFGVIDVDWSADDPVVELQIRDLDNKVQLTRTVKLSELQPAR